MRRYYGWVQSFDSLVQRLMVRIHLGSKIPDIFWCHGFFLIRMDSNGSTVCGHDHMSCPQCGWPTGPAAFWQGRSSNPSGLTSHVYLWTAEIQSPDGIGGFVISGLFRGPQYPRISRSISKMAFGFRSLVSIHYGALRDFSGHRNEAPPGFLSKKNGS